MCWGPLQLPLNFTKSCAAHLYFRMSTKAGSSRKSARKRATSKRFDPASAVGRRQRQSDDDHGTPPADQPVLNAVASGQPPSISGDAALSRDMIKGLLRAILAEDAQPQLVDAEPLPHVSQTVEPAAVISAASLASIGESPVTQPGFRSMQTPLGDHVSDKLRGKIIRGEFVELSELLQSSDPNKFILAIDTTNDRPALQLNQAASKKMLNISQWESAFRIYVAIYSTVHPCDTPALMKYWDVITQLSRDGCNWADYDRNFRLSKQSNNIPWDLIHTEFYLRASAKPRPQILRVNFRNNQPFRTQPKLTRGFCWGYERSGLCTDPYCNFKHHCQKCGGKHPQAKCRGGQNKVHQVQQKTSTTSKPPTDPSKSG